jgi:hypothetical protein
MPSKGLQQIYIASLLNLNSDILLFYQALTPTRKWELGHELGHEVLPTP